MCIAVEVKNLVKRYRKVAKNAVDDISFSVGEGVISSIFDQDQGCFTSGFTAGYLLYSRYGTDRIIETRDGDTSEVFGA